MKSVFLATVIFANLCLAQLASPVPGTKAYIQLQINLAQAQLALQTANSAGQSASQAKQVAAQQAAIAKLQAAQTAAKQ